MFLLQVLSECILHKAVNDGTNVLLNNCCFIVNELLRQEANNPAYISRDIGLITKSSKYNMHVIKDIVMI